MISATRHRRARDNVSSEKLGAVEQDKETGPEVEAQPADVSSPFQEGPLSRSDFFFKLSQMAQLTFQVVEGLEAGRVFSNLSTPLTIGREEDNDIQLNDERISRFHAKVQEDAGRIILTDLESTNGTRVNGHPIRLRVLRSGDLIMIGRCVLLLGGPEELENLRERLRRSPETRKEPVESATQAADSSLEASDLNQAFPGGAPPLPASLTPVQTAELGDLLEYFRTELMSLMSLPVDEFHTSEGEFVRVDRNVWQGLESLMPELARMLNQLTNAEDRNH